MIGHVGHQQERVQLIPFDDSVVGGVGFSKTIRFSLLLVLALKKVLLAFLLFLLMGGISGG